MGGPSAAVDFGHVCRVRERTPPASGGLPASPPSPPSCLLIFFPPMNVHTFLMPPPPPNCRCPVVQLWVGVALIWSWLTFLKKNKRRRKKVLVNILQPFFGTVRSCLVSWLGRVKNNPACICPPTTVQRFVPHPHDCLSATRFNSMLVL